jgi:hypothetical protein
MYFDWLCAKKRAYSVIISGAQQHKNAHQSWFNKTLRLSRYIRNLEVNN